MLHGISAELAGTMRWSAYPVWRVKRPEEADLQLCARYLFCLAHLADPRALGGVLESRVVHLRSGVCVVRKRRRCCCT